MQILIAALNDGKSAREVILETDDEDRDAVRDLNLLTMKPVIFVRNVSESQASVILNNVKDDKQKNQDDEYQSQDDTVLISAKIESELALLSPEEQKEYLSSLGWDQSG